MVLLAFIMVAVLVKTSLLGLGLLTLVFASIAMLCNRFNLMRLDNKTQQRFQRIFKTALGLHLLAYFGLIIKLWWIEGWQDIPAFIVSHLIFHHVLCAVVAGTLTLMAIRVYLTSASHK
ncbi:hypothetical protein ACFOEE_07820 [Pseudoalteromonas fenneropenaei]|uniref:Uncharacterized protein n=1 Tax=Pseudoalteromonas fenneropenaei TaxID=1737459 RepID=A0ABV7CIM5_9GAMM